MNAANDDCHDDDGEDTSVYLEARSVTGARYTLLERTMRHWQVAANGQEQEVVDRICCTAYGRLPVTANDDGSFTIVATRTRLVPIGDGDHPLDAEAFPGH